MRKLFPYLRNFEKESIFGPLFKLLEVCFELLVPLIMAEVIDRGIANKDGAYILKMGGLLLALGILGLISAITAQYFAAKAAYGFGTALRRDLFERCNRLSFAQLDSLGTASLITKLTGDVNQTQSGVNLMLRLFLRSPFVVIGALIMAFRIDAGAGRIFAAAIPVLAVVIYGIMLAGMPIYKKGQEILDRLSGQTRSNLTGIRVIRAFSRQKQEEEEFCETARALEGVQRFAGRVSALLNPLTYVLVNAAIILLLWQGGTAVYRGAITQGEVIALINYMTQILIALVALAQLIVTFTRASASAVRINEVLAMTPDLTDEGNLPQSPVPYAPRVEFRNVTFAYTKDSDPALQNISFVAEAGETIGIIGGIGAGKSSLAQLLPRFYDVNQGDILVDGVSVKDYPLSQLRGKMGIVPQKAVLFHGTIRENLQWRKKDATDEELLHAVAVAQGTEILAAKGDGLETMLSQGGRNLSGGQRQRLTIARALVGDPQILILDDSASALDFATEARLRKALIKEKSHATVFLISQRVAALRHADRILVLEDGKLVGNGSHDALFASCETYREICLSQLSGEEATRR